MGKNNKQLMSEAQYCARCCMPSTSEGTIFDEVDFPEQLNEIHQKHQIIYEKALSYYFSDEINQSQGNG